MLSAAHAAARAGSRGISDRRARCPPLGCSLPAAQCAELLLPTFFLSPFLLIFVPPILREEEERFCPPLCGGQKGTGPHPLLPAFRLLPSHPPPFSAESKSSRRVTAPSLGEPAGSAAASCSPGAAGRGRGSTSTSWGLLSGAAEAAPPLLGQPGLWRSVSRGGGAVPAAAPSWRSLPFRGWRGGRSKQGWGKRQDKG